MDIKRIKEILHRILPTKLNEGINFSPQDMATLKNMDQKKRQNVIQQVGAGHIAAKQRDILYKDTFSKVTKPDVNIGSVRGIEGDDVFTQACGDITNLDAVISFFRGVDAAISRYNRSGQVIKYRDYRLTRDGVEVDLVSTGNPGEYKTPQDDFIFTMEETNGSCKVKAINLEFVTKIVDPRMNGLMMKELNNNPFIRKVTGGVRMFGTGNPSFIATFK